MAIEFNNSLFQLAETVKKDFEGGRYNDDIKISDYLIYEEIRITRNSYLSNLLIDLIEQRKSLTIINGFLQKYICVYDNAFQDNPTEYIRYALPRIANLPKNLGVYFVGSVNGADEYIILQTLNELSAVKGNRILKPTRSRVYAVIDGQYIKIYGNLSLKGKIRLNIVADNPLDIPVYNDNGTIKSANLDDEEDSYPLPSSAWGEIKSIILRTLQNLYSNETDVKDDGITIKTLNNTNGGN